MRLKAKTIHTCSYHNCPQRSIISIGDTFTWTINPPPRKFYHQDCFATMKIKDSMGTEAIEAVVVDQEIGTQDMKRWVKAPELLIIGMRVRGADFPSTYPVPYEGEVYNVNFGSSVASVASIKRDDGVNGGGVDGTWIIYKNTVDKTWYGSSSHGQLYVQIEEKVKQEKIEKVVEKIVQTTASAIPLPDDGMAAMARLLAPHLSEVGIDRARDAVRGDIESLKEKLLKEIQAKLNIAPRRVEVLREEGNTTTIDLAHEKFETLLHLINNKDHVYLWGPPGSGKSTAAHQVAQALNLTWGYISLNPQTPDSRLLGFVDAHGKYRDTVFRRVYETGGVMCIDELDNSSPSLCVTINSGLENGHMAFPDGMVTKHADFVLVATGNTTGRGANHMFPERRPFDAAFQERFTYLEWDYDTKLESAVALSINDKAQFWLNWIFKLREHCKKNHPRIIVSPRASFKGAKHLKHGKFKIADLAEMVIFKGVDDDTRKSILKTVPYPEVA